MTKTLMVLGAGVFQVPLIRTAIAKGHFVITVDYLPNNVGHHESHKYINASTVDAEAVIAAARANCIDGIVTFGSDVALPTVALVADELDLVGPSVRTTGLLTDKARFRELQETYSLQGPKYLESHTESDLSDRIDYLAFPLVFKPVDTSGSRGIVKVRDNDPDRIHAAYREAMKHSRAGRVCVEEYIDGLHVSGDGFLMDGKFKCVVVTEKHQREFVVLGHSLPTKLAVTAQQQVIAEVERTCHVAGYTEGPVDFDVVVNEEAAWVVELTPRLGGNGIPELIRRATGTDVIAMTVDYALGDVHEISLSSKVQRPCASIILGSDVAGRVDTIATCEELAAKVSNVFAAYTSVQKDDHIERFVHGGQCIGYALCELLGDDTYHSLRDRIIRALRIRVKPNTSALLEEE